MRNLVGQTPRGIDYYPRTGIVNTLYRRFESGTHVFMSAPRRLGKTAIMRHLEDYPREGYHFLYIFTEPISSAEHCFKAVLEAILESTLISDLKKKTHAAKDLLSGMLNRVSGISIAGSGVELTGSHSGNYAVELKKLLAELALEGDRLILMLDEFPQTVKKYPGEEWSDSG